MLHFRKKNIATLSFCNTSVRAFYKLYLINQRRIIALIEIMHDHMLIYSARCMLVFQRLV